MKKLLSLLLIFALLCSAMLVLASCGPDNVPDDPDDGPKGTVDVITDAEEAKGENDENYVRQ